MRRTACTAKPVTSRIRRRTLPGAHRKAAEARITPICKAGGRCHVWTPIADQQTYGSIHEKERKSPAERRLWVDGHAVAKEIELLCTSVRICALPGPSDGLSR